ncbi:MAG TPA: hypothetical protein VN924_21525 [Bryobacteraceae bacterium]|nr:hypothetical protein [Bryobacteraceae bacterium]
MRTTARRAELKGIQALRAPSFLGAGNRPLQVPDEEIEKRSPVTRKRYAAKPRRSLEIGKHVFGTGPLAGVTGVLVSRAYSDWLAVGVTYGLMRAALSKKELDALNCRRLKFNAAEQGQ